MIKFPYKIKGSVILMFFHENNIQFTIKEVFLLQRKNETIYTTKKPMHCIGYRLSGKSIFYYKDQTMTVEKGQAIYVPPCISYHQKSKDETLIVIHFDASGISSREFSLARFSDISRADQKFSLLLDVWNSKQPGYQYRSNAVFYDILADVQQQNYPLTHSADKKELQLLPSLEYLHRNYYKSNLNIKEIAAISHISEVYFRKLFQELYHMSPLKYINHLRISKAMTLLKADDTPIKTIASSIGFSDPLYFSRAFKQATGISPSKFRAREDADCAVLKE